MRPSDQAAVFAAMLLGSTRPALAAGAPAPAIEDGVADTAHSFAVAVCGGSPGGCGVLCSGVLIAPNLVVTARHCVEGTNLPSGGVVDCGATTFDGDVLPASSFVITTSASTHQATSGWHDVAHIVTPGASAVSACGDDVALLVLADVLAPAEAIPATPNVTTPLTDDAALEPVETAIGYGLSPGATVPDGGSTAGYRREKPDVPILCIPDDPTSTVACTTGSSIGAKEFATGDGVCPGDSGSGAFAQAQLDDGTFLVLGVLSRGAGDASQCVGGTYTRLDLWSDFLVGEARSAARDAAYDVPAWASAPSVPLPVTGGCGVAPARSRFGRIRGLGPALLAAFLACRRARQRRRTQPRLS